MGKGRDQGGGGKGRDKGGKSREKQFREVEESEEESEEEEEVPQQKGKVGGQGATAGMMPPSDDSEEEESEDDDPPPTPKEMAAFIKSKGLSEEFMAFVKKSRKAPAAAGKPPAGYEMTKKEREAKKQEAEEEESDEEPDPEVMKRLELVKKRREAQAAQRIAADGYDRMKPLSADNRPPGSVWPPPGKEAEIS